MWKTPGAPVSENQAASENQTIAMSVHPSRPALQGSLAKELQLVPPAPILLLHRGEGRLLAIACQGWGNGFFIDCGIVLFCLIALAVAVGFIH